MSCTLLTSSDLLLSAAAQCIPAVGASGGCVCVVGGSAQQPGPAYLAAMASLRAGADRVHVVCADAAAAAAVCGFGPEVTLVCDISAPDSRGGEASLMLNACLTECQAVLVGPGLDSSPEAARIVQMTIGTAVSLSRPLIVDGSALAVVAGNPDILRGYQRAILTPNWAEFRRLCEAASPPITAPAAPPEVADVAKRLAGRLSASLGGVCVLLKGREDAVAAGPDGQAEVCALQGCGRRSAGQGALLSGLALVLANWCFAAAETRAGSTSLPPLLRHPALLAAYASAALARRCAAQAFASHRRATLARDMVDQIGPAFCRLFPEADGMR